jgi:hypothetical protein
MVTMKFWQLFLMCLAIPIGWMIGEAIVRLAERLWGKWL